MKTLKDKNNYFRSKVVDKNLKLSEILEATDEESVLLSDDCPVSFI